MDSGGGWGLVGPSCIGYDNVCCCLVGHGFGASRLSPQFILLLTETSFSGETIIPLNENKQEDPTMSKLDAFFCNEDWDMAFSKSTPPSYICCPTIALSYLQMIVAQRNQDTSALNFFGPRCRFQECG
jgi:hypothetical protein